MSKGNVKSLSLETLEQEHSIGTHIKWKFLRESFAGMKHAQSNAGETAQAELHKKRMRERMQFLDVQAKLNAGEIRKSGEYQKYAALVDDLKKIQAEVSSLFGVINSRWENEKRLTNELRRKKAAAVTLEDIDGVERLQSEIREMQVERKAAQEQLFPLSERQKILMAETSASFRELKLFVLKHLSNKMNDLEKAEREYKSRIDELQFIFDQVLPLADMVIKNKLPAPAIPGNATTFPGERDGEGRIDVTSPAVSEFYLHQIERFEDSVPIVMDHFEFLKHK